MKDSYILIAIVIICLGAGYFAGRSDENTLKKDDNRKVIDSMRVIISQKDSVIADKQKAYNEGKKTDSVNLYNINKSIKNVYYEIKKQSNRTYSVSDSLFGGYVDSLRSARGFHKIQY